MTDHAELAACPFCGLTDSIDNATQEAGVSVRPFRSPAGGTACRVECACGASGPSKREGWAATEVWNRRSPQSILLAEIAALRGENERVEADRIRTVDDRATWTRRALQAERQRDELREVLEPFAAQRVNGEENSSEIVPNGYSSAEKWRENVLRARKAIASMEPKT